MNKNIIDVLAIIHDKLKNKKIKWVVGGSTSLFLQGIALKEITDIDVMTTKEDAFKICEIFKNYEIKPVEFSETKIIKSYWGQLKIKNIKIDIMGEFSEKIGNRWVNISRKRLKHRKFKNVKNIKIPVTPLDQHLESYKILGRKKDILKIKKIEEALQK